MHSSFCLTCPQCPHFPIPITPVPYWFPFLWLHIYSAIPLTHLALPHAVFCFPGFYMYYKLYTYNKVFETRTPIWAKQEVLVLLGLSYLTQYKFIQVFWAQFPYKYNNPLVGSHLQSLWGVKFTVQVWRNLAIVIGFWTWNHQNTILGSNEQLVQGLSGNVCPCCSTLLPLACPIHPLCTVHAHSTTPTNTASNNSASIQGNCMLGIRVLTEHTKRFPRHPKSQWFNHRKQTLSIPSWVIPQHRSVRLVYFLDCIMLQKLITYIYEPLCWFWKSSRWPLQWELITAGPLLQFLDCLFVYFWGKVSLCKPW